MRDVLVAWPTSWGMRLLGAAKHTRDVYGCMCGCYCSCHWLLGGPCVGNLALCFRDEVVEALFGPPWNSGAVLLALVELASLLRSERGLRQRRCRGIIRRGGNCVLAVIAIHEAQRVKCPQGGAWPFDVRLDF